MTRKPRKPPSSKRRAGSRPGGAAARQAGPRSFSDVLHGAEPSVRRTALRLRRLVLSSMPGLEEGIYGGAKVALALYSSGGAARVICGIHPSGRRCLFYVHRVKAEDAPEVELLGQGKHSRHLEIADPGAIPERTIRRLLSLSSKRLG